MKTLLIAKDLKYARTTGSDVAAAANNDPSALADGSIGIFGIPKVSANNANKSALITDAGSDIAGIVPDSAFDGDEITIAVGGTTAAGVRSSIPMYVGAGQQVRIRASGYLAPVKQISKVGNVGTLAGLGSMNYPTSGVLRGDEVSLGVVDFTNAHEPKDPKERYSFQLKQDDTEYTALKGIVAKIFAKDEALRSISDNVKILHNGDVSTDLPNTVALTKGSTTLTCTANLLVVNDYIDLDGSLYRVAVDTDANNVELDRPWTGATVAALAAASTGNVGQTIPALLGLEIETKDVNKVVELSVSGLIEDALITLNTTPLVRGSGSNEHIKRLESECKPYLGSHDKITSYAPLASDLVPDATTTYDLYYFTFSNPTHAGGDQGKVFKTENQIIVAFVAGSSAGGQAEFEDIMGILLNGADGIGGLDA